jgi:hypothetical protein
MNQNIHEQAVTQNKKPVLFYHDDRIAPARCELPCPLIRFKSEKSMIFERKERSLAKWVQGVLTSVLPFNIISLQAEF